MGLFDFVDDAVDAVADGARDFLGDAQRFFEKAGNLGSPELGPSILDKWGPIHDNPLVKLAGSPILSAAQVAVDGLKLTMGWGEPETGEQLATSHGEMEAAGNILVHTDPDPDLWNGSASLEYAKRNSEHRHHVFEVATADKELRTVIAAEAGQVATARRELTDIANFLAEFDASTSWMSFVPGGAAVKAALDAAVAATNVGTAQGITAKLAADCWDNAAKVDLALARYQRASETSLAPGTACAPFVDEQVAGNTPPSRTQPGPFKPPDYELPPGFHPPATPYGSNPTPSRRAALAVAPSTSAPPRTGGRPASLGSPAATSPQPSTAGPPPTAPARAVAPDPRTAPGPKPGVPGSELAPMPQPPKPSPTAETTDH